MKKAVLLGGIGSILFISACSTHTQMPSTPVIARADATFETTGLGATKLKAQETALTAAKKQCGLKTPTIIEDKITYNGVLDEKTGRMIEQGVGIIGSVLGKVTPDLSRDDDYEYYIKFKCQ